jgi:hypothetical protein
MLAVDPGLTVKTFGKAASTDPDVPIALALSGYICCDTDMFLAVEKTKEVFTYPVIGNPMPIIEVAPRSSPVWASREQVTRQCRNPREEC